MSQPVHADLQPWQFLVYELALDLSRFDRTLLEPSSARQGTDISITTLADECERDPSAIERAYTLHDACHRLQPPSELDRAPIPFHLWRWGSLEARGEALPDAYFLAVADGRYVGLSSAVRVGGRPHALSSRFTGVLPTYQGRGIARALKLATVRYAIEHDYAELRATVLATNAAMLHLNEALGFVREQEFVQSYPQVLWK